MPANAVFEVNPIGWTLAFRSWSGPVGRDLTKLTMQVTALALGTVPKPGSPPRNRTGINYSTGSLAASIKPSFTYWPGSEGPELEGRVSAGSRHAGFVHEGTGIHVITPHKPHGMLANKKLGFIAFGPVIHPGTRPVPFLAEHLRVVKR